MNLETLIPCARCRSEIDAVHIGACASVGIEHGRSTASVLVDLMAAIHEGDAKLGDPHE
jgi:hypothetical protein